MQNSDDHPDGTEPPSTADDAARPALPSHDPTRGPSDDGTPDQPAQPATGLSDDVVQVRRPALPVERRAMALWALRALAVWGVLLAALLIVFGVWDSARVWLAAPAIAVGAVLLAKLAVEPWWRFRVHRWELTEHAAYATTGWLVQEWRVAPTSRIQTVDAVRGPIEQVLGLSTLRVTTASSYGAIKVQGLDRAVAEEASTRLAKAAELTEGDAT